MRLNSTSNKLGLYIHWPFCAAKCPYCDFNSYVSDSIDAARWREAYLRALDYYAEKMPNRALSTIFFGGGTPSLMSPGLAGDIIERAQRNWQVANDLEVTLEANPTSTEADKFEAFRAAGVNRVSIGVQSLRDDDLRFLGRMHSAQEAVQAIEIAASVFDRFSFDLIYARPQQRLQDWETELREALQYAGGHLSLYQLTIERQTQFYQDYRAGKFQMPEEELAADFYILTQEIMEEVELPAYEVSNHARVEQECRHNLIYWNYDDYIGIGPGAHGRITLNDGKYATRDHRAPETWLSRVEDNTHGAHPYEVLSPADQKEEALMMGLRLKGGVDVRDLDVLDFEKVDRAVKEGWVIYDEGAGNLTATREGLLRLNALLGFLISA